VKKFKDKTIKGTTYRMGHLDDMVLIINHGTERFKILVEFSSHCFTEEMKSHHTPDLAYTFEDETRAFSVERFDLSQNLRRYIREIVDENVYETKGEGYFFIHGEFGTYVVFFDMFLSTLKHYDVVIKLRSAHLRTGFTQFAAPIEFKKLVAAKAQGKKPPAGPPKQIKIN
jgi:hypothetical protein